MPKVIKQHPEKEDYFLIEESVMNYSEFKKEKPDLIELFQHTDKPIAVLGAGPTLPEDLKKIPQDCILMSVNHHAFRLVMPDYMVFLDSIERNPHNDVAREFIETVKSCTVPKITYKHIKYTDYYCINEFPKVLDPLGDSGMFGCWVASFMTKGTVYLCGMGLRKQGEPEHFYDDQAFTHWGGPVFERKKEKWVQVVKHCHNPSRIKAVSGPLVDLL